MFNSALAMFLFLVAFPYVTIYHLHLRAGYTTDERLIYSMKVAWLVGAVVLFATLLYAFNPYIMQNSSVEVVPVSHASLVLKWGSTTVYADPVGEPELYAAQPRPDIVLVTHEHSDHFSTSTLSALLGSATVLVTPQSVATMLPEELKKNLVVLRNGDTHVVGSITIQAVPAYNLREEAKQFHPQGRDNGYVLESGETRVYIAGDTEDTPEMRALKNIDIAFVPMNLPYTMGVEAAAAGVLAFAPTRVYPYHYRGQDGLSDVEKFKQLVGAVNAKIEVVLAQWY